jgi:hypothetical protein
MKELINIILRNVVKLSINKFGCNILIKIIESFEKLRGRAVNELFHNSKLSNLAKNKYGILVLESFIRCLSPLEKIEMRSVIIKRFHQDERTQKDFEKLNIILAMLR